MDMFKLIIDAAKFKIFYNLHSSQNSLSDISLNLDFM